MSMRILLSLFLALPLSAQFQRFTFGVTGGVPLGRLTQYSSDESKRYTFGLSVEAALNENVSLLFNPLYKRTGVSYQFGPVPTLFPPQILENVTRIRAHSFELPLIGKYTFGRASRSWRPFLGAGFAFQTAQQTIKTRQILLENEQRRSFESRHDFRTNFDVGAVFSAGVTFRKGRFQYGPELRFTRWGAPGDTHPRNQAQALFQIRF